MVGTQVEMKLSRFSGRDEDWSDWCVRCQAYGAFVGYEIQMDAAAVRDMRHRSRL